MDSVRSRKAPETRAPIRVTGARTHNLRDVTVEIPARTLTVVTGVSGSGKSSFAFDTLYAEGQRRYVESMSTYARQFLERMQRPDVDCVENIPPAVAIEQRNSTKNARSTVGTATEINDYLRLLYARIAEPDCPTCRRPILRTTAESAAASVIERSAGARALVVAQVEPSERESLRKAGWLRLHDGQAMVELDAWTRPGTLPVVVDRLALRASDRNRLAEALGNGWRLGGGRVEVRIEGREPVILFEGLRCDGCGFAPRPAEPPLFSYNTPLGACEPCQGFGRTTQLDVAKAIPDGTVSLAGGAIAPWRSERFGDWYGWLAEWARKRAFRLPLDVPWNDLTVEQRKMVLDGFGKFTGVRGWFAYLETKRYKMHYRILLARYRAYRECAACEGTRLRPEARAYRIAGRTICELEALSIDGLRAELTRIRGMLSRQAKATAAPLLAEIESRLAYLGAIGLGYLTLSRQVRTLSGGEAQRIHLAQALGAKLTDTLYVLDEPSVGLHPRDTHRLLEVLQTLVGRGNTVVVVEHDADIIDAAHHVIDLGPGAGAHGGKVLFEGPPAQLRHSRTSKTGITLRREVASGRSARPASGAAITVRNARAHNLKNVTVEIPVGQFVCLSGVSGSGKSTLAIDVLYANWVRARRGAGGLGTLEVGECDSIDGLDAIDDLILIDQSPLARSSRSNPATYLKAWGELRKLLARTEVAQQLGLLEGAFSFNVPGGRCEACKGQGTLTLEMHFLADVTVLCEACGGRRFTAKTLGARLGGKNVSEILDLSVDEALALFAEHPRVVERLRPFADVGLGYLRLGQSTSTLSGGEAQRLKLASYLAEPTGRRPLFLFDEPTTGLHAADVEVLLAVLDRICLAGGTVLCIEHNLDFLARADYLIDMGPEGGAEGGQVVACGSPADIARTKTHTGRHLQRVLGMRRRAAQRA